MKVYFLYPGIQGVVDDKAQWLESSSNNFVKADNECYGNHFNAWDGWRDNYRTSKKNADGWTNR